MPSLIAYLPIEQVSKNDLSWSNSSINNKVTNYWFIYTVQCLCDLSYVMPLKQGQVVAIIFFKSLRMFCLAKILIHWTELEFTPNAAWCKPQSSILSLPLNLVYMILYI